MTNAISVRACLLLGRLFSAGPLARYGTHDVEQTVSQASHDQSRIATVPALYTLFSEFSRFEGRTVLELGCARGYLLDSFLAIASFRAIGVDRDPVALADGRARYGNRIEFVQSRNRSIPLPDAMCDFAYTVDTVEHLSSPEAVFREIYRLLKPGGRFLIYFGPWLGPYSSHLSEILPFPWPHVLFSMDTLLAAAATRYESPDYVPPFYRLDAAGNRKPNPYREDWSHYLNPDMTIRGFRRLIRRLPFRVLHERRIGFGGKGAAVARFLRPLAQVPGLDEFFTSNLFCVCEKPGSL